jgi:hypothetical protein
MVDVRFGRRDLDPARQAAIAIPQENLLPDFAPFRVVRRS